MLIEKSNILNMGTEALPILQQNLQEEQSMIDWIESNCPRMIQQLLNKYPSFLFLCLRLFFSYFTK